MKNPSYFALREFLESETAVNAGLENYPTWDNVEALNRLAIEVLDPIRKQWGQPLKVTSGFRVPELNVMVGGSSTSSHMDGEAADIALVSWSKRKVSELYNLIVEMVENGEIEVDQVIYYRHKKIIHIGIGDRLRKQFIVK